MAILDFSQYFFYRWRYIIGYSIVGLLLAGLLIFAGLYVPGGLSESEMAAVIQSQQLSYTNFNTLTVLNLPYHALQDGLLHLFGPSVFVIKLPSLIIGLASALGLIALLRRWFKPNIAVLSSLIAISTGQFLFMSQLGTPDVMFVFWPIVILLLGTQVTRRRKHRALWKILFGAAVALSLYTPLSIYTLIAIAITIGLHPHLRTAVRRLSIVRVGLSALIMSLLLLPLIVAAVQLPQTLMTLAGIPLETPNLIENAKLLIQQYFVFWSPSATNLITPVFSLGSFLIIILGIYRLIRTLDTTRSYLILTWIICLTPALLLNPSLTTVTFVPAVLLLAAGITSLIDYWYRLFPRNPYARITGLIPIIILVAALIGSGVTRYVYGYHYSPQAVALYSDDLKLIPDDTAELVVSETEFPFYAAVFSYDEGIRVATEASADTVVVSRGATSDLSAYQVEQIITNDRSEDANRFTIYSKNK